MTNPVTGIFRKWETSLGALPVVEPRTTRRWFNDGAHPSPESARDVAKAVWIRMSHPNSNALRDALLAEVPELPAAARANEFAFDKWFFDLAETCRLPSLTLAAEVLVASAGAKDLTAFHPISSAGMLPVHAGQSVILHIKPSRPAYLYVLWVSPKGETLPLFPWEPGNWRAIDPEKQAPCSELRLPEENTKAWDIEPGCGLETLVVVARAQPLKKEALGEIANIAKRRLSPIDVAAPGPFEHDMPALAENQRGAFARGLNFKNPRTILDPEDKVREWHAKIAGNLRDYLEAGVCLSFRNAGK